MRALSLLKKPFSEVAMAAIALGASLLMASCGSGQQSSQAANRSPALASGNSRQVATIGVTFQYDAAKDGAAFVDPDGDTITYRISIDPAGNGFTINGGVISGLPNEIRRHSVTVTATDGRGGSASDSFFIDVLDRSFTSAPALPAATFLYADTDIALPPHFTAGPGSVVGADNTPIDNSVTNAGATLGRVLFYDRRLSVSDNLSCGSCHRQSNGFSDGARFSSGFQGGQTQRHAMGISNARYYRRGRFFWDERALTLEAQVLQPIQDPVEMGNTVPQLIEKLNGVDFYRELFLRAFGDSEITSDRIARALAQYVRSIVSYRSKYDSAFAGALPDFPAVFSVIEEQGRQIYEGRGRCVVCHGTVAHVSNGLRNNGLDAVTIDPGAGNARFKSPSLRNVAVRGPYMHDGRFATLLEVIDHYDTGVQPHPDLDQALRAPDGSPRRLNLSAEEKRALIAFLETLTDWDLISDEKFSDPFVSQ